MNKNLFKSFAVAALSILAAGCAKEQVATDGQTVEATFNVDVPEMTTITRGLSDAAQVDELVCQVFLNDGQLTPVPDLNKTVEIQNLKAKVTFTLVKGNKYLFAFWAQTKGTGYYDTADLRAVKMNTDNLKANDPKMDAFFKQKTLTATANVSPQKVSLLRALAQVNFGTIIPERSDALTLVKSKLNFTNLPNTFNVALGDKDNAYSGSVNVEFQENDVIADEKLIVAEAEYNYVATAYVFAPKNKIITDASATITLNNGSQTTVKAPNAPIQRNYRTNILGNLLTVDSEWNITVVPDFKGGEFTYDSVSANLEKGATVTLTEDYSASSKTGVVIFQNIVSSLDLNGYTFKNAVGTALDVRGSLTINGQGSVICGGGNGANAAVFVEDGGKVIINDGYYYAKKDATGNNNSCIYVQAGDPNGNTINVNGENKPLYYGGGDVEINGGVFESEGNQYVLNQHDYIENDCCFSVRGGIFVGFNPADVNECQGKVTSFVAEGYRSVETTYNGKQAWKVEKIPAVTTQEDLDAAIADVAEGSTATVYLGAGTFNLTKSNCKGNIVVKGEGKDATIIKVSDTARGGYDNKGISFENLTLDCSTSYNTDAREAQFPRTDLSFTNCNIKGMFAAIGATTTSFTNCTFILGEEYGQSAYAIKYYGGDKTSKLTVDNCVFNTCGKCILAFNEAAYTFDINVNNCTFNASKTVSGKAAIQMHTESGIKGTLNIIKSMAVGFDSSINGGLWNEVNNNTKVNTSNFTITVDGTTVQAAK